MKKHSKMLLLCSVTLLVSGGFADQFSSSHVTDLGKNFSEQVQ